MYTVKVNIWSDEVFSQIVTSLEGVQSDDADPFMSCNIGFRDEHSALIACEQSRDAYLRVLKESEFGRGHSFQSVDAEEWLGFRCDGYGVMNWAVRRVDPELIVTCRDFRGRRNMLVFEDTNEFWNFVMTHTPEYNSQEVLLVSTKEGVVYSSLQAVGDKHITIADVVEWAG